MKNSLNIQKIKELVREIEDNIKKSNTNNQIIQSGYNYSKFFSPLTHCDESENAYTSIDKNREHLIEKLAEVMQLLDEVENNQDIDKIKTQQNESNLFMDTIKRLLLQRKEYVQYISDYCLGPVRWSVHKCSISKEIAIFDSMRAKIEFTELEKVFNNINSSMNEMNRIYFPFAHSNISLSTVLVDTVDRYNMKLQYNIILSLDGEEKNINITYKFLILYLIQYYIEETYAIDSNITIELKIVFHIESVQLIIYEKYSKWDSMIDETKKRIINSKKNISKYISVFVEYVSGRYLEENIENEKVYKIILPICLE